MGTIGRCPRCKNRECRIVNFHDYAWYGECPVCGYTGRERYSGYDAIKSWNRAWYDPRNIIERMTRGDRK